MTRIDLWRQPRRWEIVLFVVWWAGVLALTLRIGGIPLDKTAIDGMYLVTLKGPAPSRVVSPLLYWSWTVLAYGLAPYLVFFIVKYARFFSTRGD